MIQSLSTYIRRFATGRIILAFFLLMLVFAAYIVPNLQKTLEASSGGNGPIDLLFSYSPETAYSMIASYGEAGRAAYLRFAVSSDIAYPVVYSIFFALSLTWLLLRCAAPSSKWQWLNLLPFGSWAFDWLENLNLATMLARYPDTVEMAARIGSVCTSIKWMFGLAAIVALVGAAAVATKNRFRLQ